ncbi:hypothetical protein BT69DRAFT_753572 [Atractiella rhizophila]|nr:hypothetical protein BT69DRAFT_753572 [Atractiella rhizophila]
MPHQTFFFSFPRKSHPPSNENQNDCFACEFFQLLCLPVSTDLRLSSSVYSFDLSIDVLKQTSFFTVSFSKNEKKEFGLIDRQKLYLNISSLLFPSTSCKLKLFLLLLSFSLLSIPDSVPSCRCCIIPFRPLQLQLLVNLSSTRVSDLSSSSPFLSPLLLSSVSSLHLSSLAQRFVGSWLASSMWLGGRLQCTLLGSSSRIAPAPSPLEIILRHIRGASLTQLLLILGRKGR